MLDRFAEDVQLRCSGSFEFTEFGIERGSEFRRRQKQRGGKRAGIFLNEDMLLF